MTMWEASGGFRTFLVVWSGQLVSQVGTSMTSFALLIWVWERTGTATPIALLGVLSAVPALLTKLVAGTLVDRWNRQRVMMVADLVAGLCSFAILLLFAADTLQVGHLYITSIVVGITGTFQGLAYSASLTVLLPKAQYARARGLISLSEYMSLIGAPLLGGVLVAVIGIGGILMVDLLTFLFAVGTLLIVRIPQPVSVDADVRVPLWRNSLLGYQYIMQRRGLLGLLLIVLAFSFAESLAFPLITPMILARTGGDEVILGTVRSLQGVGGVTGGLLLVVWGGPKRRIHGVLMGVILTGLLGDALMGLGRSLPVWIAAALGLELFIPLMLGSYHAIWQSKVKPHLQGRVFAARDLIATVGEPVARILSALLADTVVGPAMQPNGTLTPLFGNLFGTGDGAGMALIMFFGGLFTAGCGVLGYFIHSVRTLETTLQDADM
jgi:MFS transporter, DHA3 family, macrolide efflux protein